MCMNHWSRQQIVTKVNGPKLHTPYFGQSTLPLKKVNRLPTLLHGSNNIWGDVNQRSDCGMCNPAPEMGKRPQICKTLPDCCKVGISPAIQEISPLLNSWLWLQAWCTRVGTQFKCWNITGQKNQTTIFWPNGRNPAIKGWIIYPWWTRWLTFQTLIRCISALSLSIPLKNRCWPWCLPIPITWQPWWHYTWLPPSWRRLAIVRPG